MSTPRKAPAAQAGASLIELMVVVAISGIAMAAIVKFLGQSTGSMTRVESTSELVFANQRISENLKASMDGLTDIVAQYQGGSPDFTALHAAIAQSISLSASAPKQVVFSGQATVLNAGLIDLTGSSMVTDVGNELFFVSSLPPVSATVYLSGTAIVAPPPTTSMQGYVVNVDRLQFCALYLAYGHGSLKNGKAPLRLVEWRSQPYAVLNNLTQSTGTYMTASCQAMLGLGYSLAVDDSQQAASNGFIGSFYTVTGTGSTLVTGVSMPSSFAESSWAYVDEFNLTQNYHRPAPGKDWGQVRGEKTGAVVAAPSTFSFAYNDVTSTYSPVAPASYSTQSRDNSNLLVPAYGAPDMGGGTMIGFPAGFEVMIVGQPQGREILMRHVVMMGEADSVSRQRSQFLAVDGQDYFSCITNN